LPKTRRQIRISRRSSSTISTRAMAPSVRQFPSVRPPITATRRPCSCRSGPAGRRGGAAGSAVTGIARQVGALACAVSRAGETDTFSRAALGAACARSVALAAVVGVPHDVRTTDRGTHGLPHRTPHAAKTADTRHPGLTHSVAATTMRGVGSKVHARTVAVGEPTAHWHLLAAQRIPLPQPFSQPPQCRGSVVTSTHSLPHSASAPGQRPSTQPKRPAVSQVVPQDPQFRSSCEGATQDPEQRRCPACHAAS